MTNTTVRLPKPWDSPEAIALWETDPLACLLQASESYPALQSFLRREYAGKEAREIQESWACWLCHKAVEKTLELALASTLTAVVAAIIGTDGADVPVVPEEVELAVEGTAAAVAAESGATAAEVTEVSTSVIETGFRWIVANKVKAAGLFLAGELLGDLIFTPIAERVCAIGGRCTS